MKKIHSYTDSYYKSKNTIYESNGVTVLVARKADIRDFTADVIFKAGAFFEDQLNVPIGTAHFLEHMFCNPNKTLKTYDAVKRFEFGTHTRPEISTNAATWYKFVSYFGSSHPKAAERLLKFLEYRVDYPINRFSEFFENEKDTVLAEIQGLEKEEKDAGLDFQRFMYATYQHEFHNRVIGTEASVKSIGINHFEAVMKNGYVKHNAIIGIQTPENLSKKMISQIESITALIPENKTKKLRTEFPKIKNSFSYKAFHNEKSQGITFVFGYFIPKRKKVNYEETVNKFLVRTFLWFLAQKFLREEKGLVYGLSASQNNLMWDNYAINFETNVENDKYDAFLEEFYEVLFEKAVPFLDSKQGAEWFNGQISKYIFQRTVNYDDDYARDEASAYLLNEIDFSYQYSKAVAAARTLKLSQFRKFYQTFILDQKPHVWMQSERKEEEILNKFEKSELYKKWNHK